MLVHVEGAQSGGAVYRRVVLRNVFCTAGIAISFVVATLLVVLAMLNESRENNKVRLVEHTFCGSLLYTIMALPRRCTA